jgi:hypothetical protein
MEAGSPVGIYRLLRTVCPHAERRWLDALFAELSCIEGVRSRGQWLFGATGMLLDGYGRLLKSLPTVASLVLLFAVLLSGLLAVAEYEGFGLEDDWFRMLTVGLCTVLVANLIRKLRSLWSWDTLQSPNRPE